MPLLHLRLSFRDSIISIVAERAEIRSGPSVLLPPPRDPIRWLALAISPSCFRVRSTTRTTRFFSALGYTMASNYWLMKAEPDSRIVKGKDVKVPCFHIKRAAVLSL